MKELTVKKDPPKKLRHRIPYALTFNFLYSSIFTIIGLLVSVFCYGQQLKLSCVDAKGKAVPFVHAFVQHNGQIVQGWTGDHKGKLIISHEAILSFDSLKITAIGYHPLTVDIASIPQLTSASLRLKKNTTILNEVIVSADKSDSYSKNLGTFKGQKRLGSWSYNGKGNSKFGSTLVAYVRNTESRIGHVEMVKIKLSLHSEPGEAFFRLAIFSVDTTLNKPGKAILDSAIFVKQQRKLQRWLKVDLESYPIPFPKEGLFIGLQYIATDTIKSNQLSPKETIALLKSKNKNAIQQYLNHRATTKLQKGGQIGTYLSQTWRKRSFIHEWEPEKPNYPEKENFFAPELIVKTKIVFYK